MTTPEIVRALATRLGWTTSDGNSYEKQGSRINWTEFCFLRDTDCNRGIVTSLTLAEQQRLDEILENDWLRVEPRISKTHYLLTLEPEKLAECLALAVVPPAAGKEVGR